MAKRYILLCAVILIIANSALFYFLSGQQDRVGFARGTIDGNFSYSNKADIVIFMNLIFVLVGSILLKKELK